MSSRWLNVVVLMAPCATRGSRGEVLTDPAHHLRRLRARASLSDALPTTFPSVRKRQAVCLAWTMASVSFGNANSGLQVGVSYGPIHLPPDRPETPPSPLSTVPFRRDPDFVDRGTLLDQIQEKGSVPGSRIALVGLGGVGKSQLAIEYSYRVRDRSSETWVFWIHASNATRFEQSCRDIADRVKIPGRRDPKTNIFKLLQEWLQDEERGKWVLVLDNVDDDQFLHPTPPAERDGPGRDHRGTLERSIWTYFPQSLKGSMIMTSRSRRVVSSMVEMSDIITVEPMDQLHATALFENKLGMQVPREDVIQLTAALEWMPLAIVQAAAYIKQRAPRLSVSQYLRDFRKSDRKKIAFLGYEGGHLRRDPEAANAILLTWQMSFDHIQQMRPSAAGLLSLMSFFDRQGIPDRLLRESTGIRDDIRSRSAQDREDREDTSQDHDGEESASDSSVVDEFEDDIVVLRDYSLISIGVDETNFEMHRLVQLAMREWLKAHNQLERWKERFIRNLCSNFPTEKFDENRSRCEMLFAHVECAAAQQPDAEAALGEWASLLHRAAWFAWTRGNFVSCKRMAEQAARTRKELFGLENEETLGSIELLGVAFTLGGQWRKAEELYRQAMEIRRQVQGPDHPSTLASMDSLALIYYHQGRWTEAEELQVQVIEARKQVLGPDHPNTLASMDNLTLTYLSQGRWEQAEDLNRQVMEIRNPVQGSDHPDTLASMGKLASIYYHQGQYQEAEALGIQVMETCKQVLGADDPSTLAHMQSLSEMYWNQGRYQKAEELQLQVMRAYQQVLGPDHPQTLASMHLLALTCVHQGRWKEAEELQVRVMETHKQILGPKHPDTLNSMYCLALTCLGQGQWRKEEELQVQVTEIRKQVLGPDHPDTVSSMDDLETTYWYQERWEDAKVLGGLVDALMLDFKPIG